MCERPKNVRESIKTIDRLSMIMIAWVKYDGIHVPNKIMFNVSSTLKFLIEINNNYLFYLDSENKMM